MADQIDEVKQKTDIVSLISEYIDLKKAGRNYKANCPFHGEKTPSFMVSPELQIYKCFGCGEAGDAFSFLQKHEGMDFYEALKHLADKAGIKLKQTSNQARGEKDRLYEVNYIAARAYQYVLLKHKAGKEALDYFKKTRGIKEETIKTFQLGYSPDRPFALRNYLIEKKKISLKELDKVGLIYQRNGRVFDRFRGRVIFPLFDHRGNNIGFAGRILPKDDKKDLAKYINSPETPIYHKSNTLYGLNLTRSSVKKENEVVVVEGELDAISSYQAGVKNVVAIKGTAITQEQVQLLHRFAKSMTLALDTDLAGDAAARRGISIAQNQGFDIKVAVLKGFKDPDDAARKDPKAYKETLKNAIGVWDFIVDSIFSKHDRKTGEGKSKISKEITPILSSIEDKIVQAHYIKMVSERLGVGEEAVSQQVANVSIEEKSKTPELAIKGEDERVKGRRELLEERLLTLAFQCDPDTTLDRKIISLIKTPLAKRIIGEYKEFKKNKKKFNPSSFSKSLPKELAEGFSEMMLKDMQDFVDDPRELEKEVFVVKQQLKLVDIKEELSDVSKKIKIYEKEKNKKESKKAQEEFSKLVNELSSLEQELTKGIIL